MNLNPPIAEKKEVTTNLHGETRSDPYAWLKDTRRKKDSKIISYLEAENHYADQIMSDTKQLQEKIYSETLGHIQEDDQTVPYQEGSYFYYSVTQKGKEYPLFYRKKAEVSELILDLNQLAKGHKFLSLGSFAVSPNGQMLAYSLDFDGSRKHRLYFKNLSNSHSQRYSEVIPEISGQIAWANDNQTIFYATYDPSLRVDKVFRHTLGTDIHSDVEVIHEKDEKYSIELYKTRSLKYVLVISESKNSTECNAIDADHPNSPPRIIEPRKAAHRYYVDHHDENFIIRTNDQSPMFRIVTAPIQTPSAKNWKPWIPAQPNASIENLYAFQNFAALTMHEKGLEKIQIVYFSNQPEKEIRFPDKTYSVSISNNHEYSTNFLRIQYESLGTPASIFDYDIQKGKLALKKQTPVPGFQSEHYETDRIFAQAQDGTQIPISLVYKKGLKKDQSHPALLYGYGSYGYPVTPKFSTSRISLLDRGFVYAIAHIRGGGEYGDPWYQNGKLLKKKNTFTDFISCAEFLIQKGYTQPKKLVIEGRSAGGLLMGAVMNFRPDLFQAVLAEVPFVDVINTMLDASIPLTTEEYEEWGNPNVKQDYEYMKSYSPYDNVEAKSYPHMLLTGGLYDSQVPYWEPAKLAAKLRAKKTDHHLLLLKTEMDFGHRGASGRYDSIRKRAFELAFLLKSLGISK